MGKRNTTELKRREPNKNNPDVKAAEAPKGAAATETQAEDAATNTGASGADSGEVRNEPKAEASTAAPNLAPGEEKLAADDAKRLKAYNDKIAESTIALQNLQRGGAPAAITLDAAIKEIQRLVDNGADGEEVCVDIPRRFMLTLPGSSMKVTLLPGKQIVPRFVAEAGYAQRNGVKVIEPPSADPRKMQRAWDEAMASSAEVVNRGIVSLQYATDNLIKYFKVPEDRQEEMAAAFAKYVAQHK